MKLFQGGDKSMGTPYLRNKNSHIRPAMFNLDVIVDLKKSCPRIFYLLHQTESIKDP